jgi:DNA polymerase-3 subunit alpha
MTSTETTALPVSPIFIPLRQHSAFSLRESVIRLEPLLQQAVAWDLPALAITDRNNMFALVKFYKAAVAKNIKPILGCEVIVKSELGFFPLVLLCQNAQGFENLSKLLTRMYQLHHREPHLEKSWLIPPHTDGLLALSAGLDGELGLLYQKKTAVLEAALKDWQARFPKRFYLEVFLLGKPQERAFLARMREVSARLQLPLVATQPADFLHPDDAEAQDIRYCIAEGIVREAPHQRLSKEQHPKSPQEMAKLFAEVPEALANSVAIARRCTVPLTFGRYALPDFPTPNGESLADFLAAEAKKGLTWRFQQGHIQQKNSQQSEIYQERLSHELQVIQNMGFSGYFLIVADFIQWAKQQGIPVGPGRGSGAGSLVAYALQITDLDPLAYALLFERFLNPERVSMPDFDIDFCIVGREKVIDYVEKRYGREQVAQIITFGTMAARAVLRDVGRVLGFSYAFMDRIAKLIPAKPGTTLDKALEESPDFKNAVEKEEEVANIVALAKKLENLPRNVGTHAAGVIIAPRPLFTFCPLYQMPGETSAITQLDKDDSEAVGLIKFDFLGLRNLTIIAEALTLIEKNHGIKIDINTLPLDDRKTYQLLASGKTEAVFQLESEGMQRYIKALKPEVIEDIIAMVALYRPGPLQSGMVQDFIDRKQGKAEVCYPHPLLINILKPTYGVIVYQEQVMQIAQVLAGYSLGGADLLRRAMGKKKPSEMQKQRSIFLAGAEKNGIDADTANSIFDLMEKFAEYGFNKSHSAAYALISYQTAYLKAHYPTEFMTAVLNSEIDRTDKLMGMIYHSKALGIQFLPPDINQSDYYFTVAGNKSIRYGLGAIRGAGQSACEALLRERQKQGTYRDLFALCGRLEHSKVNQRVLEQWIKAGAMADLGDSARLLAALPQALQQRSQAASLFADSVVAVLPQVPAATAAKQSLWEREALGFSLFFHPLQETSSILKDLGYQPLSSARSGDNPNLYAWLAEVKRQFKFGKRLITWVLEDENSQKRLRLSPKEVEDFGDSEAKQVLLLNLNVWQRDDGREWLKLKSVTPWVQQAALWAESLSICLPLAQAEGIAAALKRCLQANPGTIPVQLLLSDTAGVIALQLPPTLAVAYSEDLLSALAQRLPHADCHWKYKKRLMESVA